MVPRVRVLTLWGARGDWPARRARLRAGLEALRPDLVAFQEAIVQEAIVTEAYDQVADRLGPDYDVAHQSAREADGQGLSIASRARLGAVHEVDLHVTERTGGSACATLVAEIDDVLFANHLPSWQLDFEIERELQAVAATRALSALADGRHVVVAGDFDADPTSASVRFWTGRQSLHGYAVCYRDAWEAVHPDEPRHTFTPDNPLVADPDWPFRRIDYILVRCALHGGPTLPVSDCFLAFDDPPASDHFAVVADLG
jgi:endonuclease/exonuclease/phosphatase family metal-dependent hydrolase